jgi:hypothetical protein
MCVHLIAGFYETRDKSIVFVPHTGSGVEADDMQPIGILLCASKDGVVPAGTKIQYNNLMGHLLPCQNPQALADDDRGCRLHSLDIVQYISPEMLDDHIRSVLDRAVGLVKAENLPEVMELQEAR